MPPDAPAGLEPALAALLADGQAGAQGRRPRPVVLLVDDEPVNIEVLAGGLDGYDIVFASNGAEALAQAAVENPDLIILDVMMPDLDGYEVCRRLKADERLRQTPVIFVTAMNQVGDEVRGLEIGAVDYITKPVSLPVMRARVKTHLELKLVRDVLEGRAWVDGLTGLANRRRFDEFLTQEWRRAARNQTAMALVMLDVDFFKRYNDHYGHLAGDTCLRQVAEVLRSALQRPGDLAARYGGEEFACLLPETEAAGAWLVAERIQAGLAALSLPHARSAVSKCVTVSQGVAILEPAAAQAAAELVQAADRLLYAAKAGGRNRIEADPARSDRLP
ncbi:MAG: diguanylate cyclase [Anaerolineales bacterium]|nr:diguanylate cyclase [Anaerolineales bacterium]